MSIVSEIGRIKNNITNAYDKTEEKGATIPDNKNSENLASTINSISGGDSNNFEYLGTNPVLVDKYRRTWTNADANYDFSAIGDGSSKTVKRSSSAYDDGAYVLPASFSYNYGSKDVFILQKCYAIPKFSDDTPNISKQIFYMGAKNTIFFRKENTTARTTFTIDNNLVRYYNANGEKTLGFSQGYGLICTISTPSFFNAGADTTYIRIYTPAITVRAGSSYLTLEDVTKIVDFEFVWDVEIWALDHYSSLPGKINKLVEDIVKSEIIPDND